MNEWMNESCLIVLSIYIVLVLHSNKMFYGESSLTKGRWTTGTTGQWTHVLLTFLHTHLAEGGGWWGTWRRRRRRNRHPGKSSKTTTVTSIFSTYPHRTLQWDRVTAFSLWCITAGKNGTEGKRQILHWLSHLPNPLCWLTKVNYGEEKIIHRIKKNPLFHKKVDVSLQQGTLEMSAGSRVHIKYSSRTNRNVAEQDLKSHID